jgi:hypothetical protein
MGIGHLPTDRLRRRPAAIALAAVLSALTVLTTASACRSQPPPSSRSPAAVATPAATPAAPTTDPTPPTAPTVPTAAPSGPKQAGITHPAWGDDEYSLAASDRAYGEIIATGATWVVLVPTWYQPDRQANELAPDADNSVSDAGVLHAIHLAHQTGLKVMLKPHVDLPDDADRADIQPADPDRWFRSYSRFIVHYADLAAQAQVDQLSVGTELRGTSGQTDRWRTVISAVRAHYRGPLVYAANYDEYDGIQFWDAVDFIGIDAYWPLASRPTTDVDALRAAWSPIADRLASFSARWGRPVLFTEAGYTSQVGTTTAPYDWLLSHHRSDAEQAAAYRALLQTFWPLPWFAGVHWWMWDDIPGRSHDDQSLDYTPHGKAAEAVLRELWSSSRLRTPEFPGSASRSGDPHR